MFNVFANHYVQGALIGAGLLAFFQNHFDYRVDTEFLEYVWNPIVTFVKRFFGGQAKSILEAKGKALANDVHAKLTTLLVAGETDVNKVLAEIKKIHADLKAKL